MATSLQIKKRPALIILAGALALIALVLGFGPEISHWLDRVVTVHEDVLPSVQFAAVNGDAGTPRGGSLTIGKHQMSNAGLDLMAYPLHFQPVSNGQLVLSSGGKTFVLGSLASSDRDATTGVLLYRFTPGPGDEVIFEVRRSVLSWPTPFRINYMTGAPSPTWGRTLYYWLRWRKPTGARLEIVWTYDQAYLSGVGWQEVWTRGGTGGLVRLEIRP